MLLNSHSTHHQAGIAFFSHHFFSNIFQVCVATYTVIIETITLKVVGTYIPSSAPIKVFEATLNSCPDVDLLFGDINVKFGTSWNDALQHPLEIFRAVSGFCANQNFCHVRSDDNNSPKLTMCLQECLYTATLSLVLLLLTLIIPLSSLKRLVLPCQPQYLTLDSCGTTSGVLSSLAPVLYLEVTLKLLFLHWRPC
ncbi:hypothetical protein DSO57_1022422 [Entomophthora muscae]|uniref:Uncharacterized protein n=1 Tax=Entomophthora muscae TaxID=34485 RepID=A0ACC2S5A6_9FUNG|nr:hypothetical protein DSO57_1022422 [Entomophthora muscae]